MSSSLIFNATIAGVLLFAGSVQAKECYENANDYGLANPPAPWVIVVNDDWTLTWKQGDKTIELDTMSAGTGMPQRGAFDPISREIYPYLFHKGDLIFDMTIYEPVKCPEKAG